MPTYNYIDGFPANYTPPSKLKRLVYSTHAEKRCYERDIPRYEIFDPMKWKLAELTRDREGYTKTLTYRKKWKKKNLFVVVTVYYVHLKRGNYRHA